MPPARGSRPTAFEVSFGPGEVRPGESTSLNNRRPEAANSSPFRRPNESFPPPAQLHASNFNNRYAIPPSRPPNSAAGPSRSASTHEKRKNNDIYEPASARSGKRPRPLNDPVPRYSPSEDEYMEEEKRPVIHGEDSVDNAGSHEKPIRLLSNFTIFDPKQGFALVPLTVVNEGNNREVEAVGNVTAVFAEEDAGQEADYVDGAENPNEEQRLQRIRTAPILHYTMNYGDADEPMYIETPFAWYILRGPSPTYKRMYYDFYKPHRTAQLIISWAQENQTDGYRAFEERFLSTRDEQLGMKLTRDHIQASASIIYEVTANEAYQEAAKTPLVTELLRNNRMGHQGRKTGARVNPPVAPSQSYTGNVDLQVLQPVNQKRTTVTHLVSQLSSGLFREKLLVVAPPPRYKHTNKRKEVYRRLLKFLKEANRVQRNIEFPSHERLRDVYWKLVKVNGVEYRLGDVVVAPAGQYEGRMQLPIPNTVTEDAVSERRTLADYFWFGRIVSINQRGRTAHIQWFEHASKTLLQEIHDPQELFMTEICDTLELRLIVGKVNARRWDRPLSESERRHLDPLDFFYSFTYNQKTGSFTSMEQVEIPLNELRGNSCDICLKASELDTRDHAQLLGVHGSVAGVALRGTNYHINDFAMVRSDSGACIIGQLLDIKEVSRRGPLTATIQVLGRMNELLSKYPHKFLKDERHLFLTDSVMDIGVDDLIGPCRVVNHNTYPDVVEWLALSPHHFYVTYHFPSVEATDWETRTALTEHNAKRLEVCSLCYTEDRARTSKLKEFLKGRAERPLRTFDPFGGAGTFGLAMEESGCMKLTHAVEITPSAAKTLKENSPDTVVYNQCANVVLQYSIRAEKQGVDKVKNPLSIGNKQPLPPPPREGDVDCIVAGFPCQPHSRLNMFQKANDRKSHLILNLLSWIDYLKPAYGFFENVRGFLAYNLNAVQVDQYRVEGGIEMGGLKFFIRALLAMGYQLRFCLLQAAHYGVPQARVRFFLVAARLGHPLPELPQPLYHFPLKDSMEIKFPHGLSIRPIDTQDGIAPFNFITIDDAISDLPRFDWANPGAPREKPRKDPQDPRKIIPLVACDRTKAFCGISRSGYHHEPRTLFQLKAREPKNRHMEDEDDLIDLQHITRVLKEDVIERVVAIPLRAKADYSALFDAKFRHLWEWQFSDPKSSIARCGYRPGFYGRLDKDGWFRTTVTNVEPTAKQSWVLNPYCKRVVTVRELARSQGFPDYFKFHCVTDDIVKTMQREIGNAVPWPIGVALGRELREALFKKWLKDKENPQIID